MIFQIFLLFNTIFFKKLVFYTPFICGVFLGLIDFCVW